MRAFAPLTNSSAAPATSAAPAGTLGATPARRHVGALRTRPAAGPKERSGYFGDADPSIEVRPVKSDFTRDVTKRGGRWESDFIWNKDWAKQLDYEESLRKQQAEGRNGGAKQQPGKGFLSLTSRVDLNSMDVDLSEQLRARRKSGGDASPSSTATPNTAPQRKRQPVRYGSVPPTRVEQRAWERGGKFSRKVVAVPPTNEAEQDALAAKLAAEQQRYEELKAELQAWAAGLTVACLAATYAFYGRDVAASYGVGALGGLVYLRLLNSSVDSVGGGLGGALGQPRLLIPVILALGYNRYNSLVSDQMGLTLQLLPMLLGFFTYKGAVLAKQSLALFAELAGGQRQQADSGATEGESRAALDVASVDRAFRKRMMDEI